MEKFNYYFNTRERIDSVLNGPINKATMPSVLFNLVWDIYHNISTDEQNIKTYIENWISGKTKDFHMSVYAKTIRLYIKKVKDMPWRNIQDTVKIRKSELDYISSFDDIKIEKLLFCYLAIAKFMDMSRKSPTHWESESDSVVFKMARVVIPAKERDYFINNIIDGEYHAKIHHSYGNDDMSKRIDYISDDESDPVVIELNESNYYELAFTYLNWKNGGGYKKCKGCGRLFRVKNNKNTNDRSETSEANRTQYCRNCSPKYEPKYKGKDDTALDYEPRKAVCEDCGEEFYIENYKNTRTCRCNECRKLERQRINREYYEKNKN